MIKYVQDLHGKVIRLYWKILKHKTNGQIHRICVQEESV